MAMKKTSLGRNLNALLGSLPTEKKVTVADGPVSELKVDLLQRGKFQPRNDFEVNALTELSDSIKSQGIIQPILVRPIDNNKYEIIAGERRWRAAQMAGLTEVPVIIRKMNDKAAMATGLIENIQREDLNPVEVARALARLMEEFSLTHQEAAEAVGKSRATVSNLLRLLTIAAEVKDMLEQNLIEMGHARALLSLENAKQIEAANQIIQKGLSVRETERLVRNLLSGHKSTTKSIRPLALDGYEKELKSHLNTKVSISQNANGSGKIVIHYKDEAVLEQVIDHLKQEV